MGTPASIALISHCPIRGFCVWSMQRLKSSTCHRATARKAYTLIEITIVLAIIAMFAAISWPVMMRPWQQSLVQGDAQKLKEVLNKTRHTAISKGTIYEFRYKPGTNEYEIRSKDRILMEPVASQTTPEQLNNSRQSTALSQLETDESSFTPKREHDFLVRGRLSEGIKFAPDRRLLDAFAESNQMDRNRQPIDSAVTAEPQAQPNQPQAQPNQPQEQQIQFHWANAIAFFPNGRTNNASFVLHSDDGFAVTTRLRGFTGSIEIDPTSEIKSLDGGERVDGESEGNAIDVNEELQMPNDDAFIRDDNDFFQEPAGAITNEAPAP